MEAQRDAASLLDDMTEWYPHLVQGAMIHPSQLISAWITALPASVEGVIREYPKLEQLYYRRLRSRHHHDRSDVVSMAAGINGEELDDDRGSFHTEIFHTFCASLDPALSASLDRDMSDLESQLCHARLAFSQTPPQTPPETTGGVKQVRSSRSPIFVRLSTRSPKDCLLRCNNAAVCCCNTALDVVATLASSQRCFDDVTRQRKTVPDSVKPPMLVFRPFVSLLCGWSELRVFVFDRRVVAVSAYNALAIHETCAEDPKEGRLGFLQAVTRSAWGQNQAEPQQLSQHEQDEIRLLNHQPLGQLVVSVIKSLAGRAEDFVVDVGFVRGGGGGAEGESHAANTAVAGGGRWVVIEINPYGRATSGCLFSWTLDKSILCQYP